MKKKNFNGFIIFMCLSLAALVGFQLYWIDTVLKANESRFTNDVLDAMYKVAVKIEKNETVKAFHQLQNVATFQNTLPPRQRGDSKVKRRMKNPFAVNTRHPFHTTKPRFYFDTIRIGNEFQVFLNYEFSTLFPQPLQNNPGGQSGKPTEGWENEWHENQSKILDLEAQLLWISNKYEMTAKVLDNLLVPKKNLLNRINPFLIDSLLKTELNNKGVNLKYDFGVLNAQDSNLIFVNYQNKKEALLNSHLKTSMFPNDITENSAFLVLDFPDKTRFLLEKIWVTMVSSGILIFIIALAFGYSITTILKQKKLSLMKNDFINNMTHELKTPIATVSLATEALQDKTIGTSQEMRNRYLGMIKNENNRLGNQVERVLRIAAIEKQDFNLKLEKLNLHQIIQNSIENMKIQAESRKGRILAVLQAQKFTIKADKTHIENCISNLVDNAIKYSVDSPNIIIRTENKKERLYVSIQDHGLGMSKDTQKRVFEKFYRKSTGNRHDVKGFGLGLSYVKSMIEAHKGDILVESTLGKGSKFTIVLPMKS